MLSLFSLSSKFAKTITDEESATGIVFHKATGVSFRKRFYSPCTPEQIS